MSFQMSTLHKTHVTNPPSSRNYSEKLFKFVILPGLMIDVAQCAVHLPTPLHPLNQNGSVPFLTSLLAYVPGARHGNSLRIVSLRVILRVDQPLMQCRSTMHPPTDPVCINKCLMTSANSHPAGTRLRLYHLLFGKRIRGKIKFKRGVIFL